MSSPIEELQRRTALLPEAMAAAIGAELAGWAAVIAATARSYIGTERPDWAALQPDTLRQKQLRGETGRISPSDPLFASGALRDSIGAAVEATDTGFRLTVGSTDPIAVFHELGTGAVPARTFLARALAEHVDAMRASLQRVAEETTRRILFGR